MSIKHPKQRMGPEHRLVNKTYEIGSCIKRKRVEGKPVTPNNNNTKHN